MVNIPRNASGTDAFITDSKRAIQKRAETTFDLTGNRTKLHGQNYKSSQQNNSETVTNEYDKEYLKKDIHLQKKNKKLLMN